MATQRMLNAAIDTTTASNWFSVYWKLTRVMKAAGWTYKASGNGTSKDTSGTASSDLWGGNADPLTDTYPAAQLDTRAAWWCAEGPSTVKIGITSASSGTFLRGEVVTQSTSGATGELLGYVINTAGNSGWLVIMPHTGTFDNSHMITGDTSFATVTATSYNLFRRQFVFAKHTNLSQGYVFYECLSQAEIDASSSTALFSDLAGSANCSSTVCPGNSASGSNRFPSYGIAIIGVAEGAVGNFIYSGFANMGKAQIVATNVTPSTGVSADGTFWISTYNVTNTSYDMRGFFRLDDTEPGDVDPFAVFWPIDATAVASTRTSGANPNIVGLAYQDYNGINRSAFRGYCARGTGTMGSGIDTYTGFYAGLTYAFNGNSTTAVPAQMSNQSFPTKIRNHPDFAGVPPSPFEHFTLFSGTAGLTMRKGITRWLGTMPIGSVGGTWSSITWLNLNTSASYILVVGPLDGVTTIINS